MGRTNNPENYPLLTADPAATPASGRFFLFGKKDATGNTHLYRKDPDGTVTQITENVVGVGGGTPSNMVTTDTAQSITGLKTFANGFVVDEMAAAPATPTSGVRAFVRNKARRLLSIVGPSGLDVTLQPALFSNRTMMLSSFLSSAVPSVLGPVGASTTGASAVTPVYNTTFAASLSRILLSVTSSVTAAVVRTSTFVCHLSATANQGGFFFVSRLTHPSTSSVVASVGLFNSTTASQTTPANSVCFVCPDATNQWFIRVVNSAGTAVDTSLGSGFVGSASTDVYEFRLFAPSGSASTIFWSATRLNDGTTVTGSITSGLPSAGVGLVAMTNIVYTSASATMPWISIYVETDN